MDATMPAETEPYRIRLVVQRTADAFKARWIEPDGQESDSFPLALPLDEDAREDLHWYFEDYVRFVGAGDRISPTSDGTAGDAPPAKSRKKSPTAPSGAGSPDSCANASATATGLSILCGCGDAALAFYSGDLPHRPGSRWWQLAAFGLEMVDDVLDDFTELCVELGRIVTVYPRDQIRTSAEVDLIFFAPFDPFVVPIAQLHR